MAGRSCGKKRRRDLRAPVERWLPTHQALAHPLGLPQSSSHARAYGDHASPPANCPYTFVPAPWPPRLLLGALPHAAPLARVVSSTCHSHAACAPSQHYSPPIPQVSRQISASIGDEHDPGPGSRGCAPRVCVSATRSSAPGVEQRPQRPSAPWRGPAKSTQAASPARRSGRHLLAPPLPLTSAAAP